MEFKINDVNISEKELEVTYTFDEIKKDLDIEVQKQTKKLQIPGFRKGKVPAPLLKKMFGDAFEQEASEKVAGKKFWDVAEENHLHPIGKPAITDIKFVPGESLFFKITYEVLPQIEAKDYKGLDIEVPDLVAKDEDVEHEIKHILKANETFEPSDVVSGDDCTLDVDIQRVDKDGKPFEGSKQESLQIDLSNQRVAKEIIENSKDKKVGESFKFTFNDVRTIKNKEGVDEKFTEVLEYNAVIKAIKKSIIPLLDEALIKKVTKDKVSTEPELKEQIRNDIQSYYEHQIDDILRNKLITQIISNNEFNPPKSLLANVLEDYVKREEEEAKKQGYKKYDKEEGKKRLAKSAEVEVKWYILKEAIQKQEDISISDEELNQLAAKDAAETGIAVEKLITYYKSSNYSSKIIENKVFQFLKENNNIKKVEPDKSHIHNHEEHEHEG
ncbi:MAG: trigger factor [Ignavibacteriaceae bacterium]|nr:trigger factor [Ignavibacteriaceae bacterium]